MMFVDVCTIKTGLVLQGAGSSEKGFLPTWPHADCKKNCAAACTRGRCETHLFFAQPAEAEGALSRRPVQVYLEHADAGGAL
jgi:hypothetical protein